MTRSEFLTETSRREGTQGTQLEAESESTTGLLLCLPSGLQELLACTSVTALLSIITARLQL